MVVNQNNEYEINKQREEILNTVQGLSKDRSQVCARQRQKLASLPRLFAFIQIRFAFAISAYLSFPTNHLPKCTEKKD